jgi:hypothetical protein
VQARRDSGQGVMRHARLGARRIATAQQGLGATTGGTTDLGAMTQSTPARVGGAPLAPTRAGHGDMACYYFEYFGLTMEDRS